MRALRENLFLVAAAVLPILVIGVFLLASAIPKWTVPPPAYDLIFRASGPHDPARPPVGVDFTVRDGRVEAVVRRLPPGSYSYEVALFLFDHETGQVRHIPFVVPEPPAEGEDRRTVAVESLAGVRVLGQLQAPDGYELQYRNRGESGIVGALFGMSRYGRRIVLEKDGRAIPIELPSPYGYQYLPEPLVVGWVMDGSR